MLRGLIVGLLLANAIFWAWTQGWLTGVTGVDPRADHEPQRLGNQIAPELIRIVSPRTSDSSAVAGGAAEAGVCMEAGPFATLELAQAQAALRTVLPAEAWTLVRRDKPGSWFIYMGRYPGRDALQRKIDELKRLNVNADELRGFAELEPGLVLGRYNNVDAAQAALKHLAAQRVRNARVVQLAAPVEQQLIRIPDAGPELQGRLVGLKPQLAGRTFTACRNGG